MKLFKMGPKPTSSNVIAMQKKMRRTDKYTLPIFIGGVIISIFNVHKFAARANGGNAVWAAIAVLALGLSIGQIIAQRILMKALNNAGDKNGKKDI